eukprot:6990418-Pyramimonas_sp.AAC.1
MNRTIKSHLHSTSPPHARYAGTPARMNDSGWTARLPRGHGTGTNDWPLYDRQHWMSIVPDQIR